MSLSTINLLTAIYCHRRHVALRYNDVADDDMLPSPTCCPRRHVALGYNDVADDVMLLSPTCCPRRQVALGTSMSPTTTCCLNMLPKIQFCRIVFTTTQPVSR